MNKHRVQETLECTQSQELGQRQGGRASHGRTGPHGTQRKLTTENLLLETGRESTARTPDPLKYMVKNLDLRLGIWKAEGNQQQKGAEDQGLMETGGH